MNTFETYASSYTRRIQHSLLKSISEGIEILAFHCNFKETYRFFYSQGLRFQNT